MSENDTGWYWCSWGGALECRFKRFFHRIHFNWGCWRHVESKRLPRRCWQLMPSEIILIVSCTLEITNSVPICINQGKCCIMHLQVSIWWHAACSILLQSCDKQRSSEVLLVATTFNDMQWQWRNSSITVNSRCNTTYEYVYECSLCSLQWVLQIASEVSLNIPPPTNTRHYAAGSILISDNPDLYPWKVTANHGGKLAALWASLFLVIIRDIFRDQICSTIILILRSICNMRKTCSIP